METDQQYNARRRKATTTFVLVDTFNNRRISRHRTLATAINARDKHLAAVRRANGRDAFLTYAITRADGSAVDRDELHREEEIAYRRRWA